MSESADFQWQAKLAKSLGTITEQVSRYKEGDHLRDHLPEQLGVSGGENFSAEDHRDREVLELLQNATDATGVADSSVHPRTIYVQITDEGMLVANTGENFDFKKDSVRNSLRILGHSNKDTETIGEFGVGLTSIRAAGEAYEVWTKADSAGGVSNPPPRDCWRVRCGPENVLGAVAQYAEAASGNEVLDRMQEEIQGGSHELSRGTNDTDIDFDLGIDDFPYFLYPLALRDWKTWASRSEYISPLRARAHQLLSGETPDGGVLSEIPSQIQELIPCFGAFTTAVFVECENEPFRSLFSTLSGAEPEPSEEQAIRLRNQAWFDGRDTSEITPELLLNLGGIDRLVVEDGVTASGGESDFQIWNIEAGGSSEQKESSPTQVIEDGEGRDAVRGRQVAVSLTESLAATQDEWPDTQEYQFWQFTYQEKWKCDDISWFDTAEGDNGDEGDVPDRLSVLVPTDTWDTRYRPHLYYPIRNAAAAFPVCPHGDFTVQQNRQNLAADDIERNCAVAAGLARLIGRVAEVLVTSSDVSSELSQSVPWNLLPDVNDVEDDLPEAVARRSGEVSRNSPFDALRAAIYDELGKSKCLPISSDSSPISLGGEAPMPLLHSDIGVFVGIASLYGLHERREDAAGFEAIVEETDWSVIQQSTIRTACSWLAGGQGDTKMPLADSIEAFSSSETPRTARFERLVSEGLESGGKQLSVAGWADILKAWSTQCCSGDSPALSGVDKRVANRLLDGTTRLAELHSDGEEIDPDQLNKFVPTERGKGPFLLPCGVPAEDDGCKDPTSDSASIHLVRVESHEGDATLNTRQVLRPESSKESPLIPDETGFSIYVLTKSAMQICGQSISDANWGTTLFGGSTDFYRTLLKDATKREQTLPIEDIAYLANQYEAVQESEAKELEASEGSYHRQSLVDGLVASMEQISENPKIRLDGRRVSLPPSILNSEGPQRGRDVEFDVNTLIQWLGTDDETALELEEFPSVGNTSIDIDGERIERFAREEGQNLLISTLGILGVSILPGVRVLTLYRDEASPPRRNNSWNPTAGDGWETKATHSPRTAELRKVLETTVGDQYLRAISGIGFDPVDSANHTANCPVRSFPASDETRKDLQNKDVMLASWVWLSPDISTQIDASTVAKVLRLSDGELTDTVFRTGWSCNQNQGASSSIDIYVPTLLSWQLRSIGGWEDVESTEFVRPEMNPAATTDGWETDAEGWTLKYAVLDSAADPERHSGQKSTRFLPRVNPQDSSLSETALRRLGVKPIDELNATEASIRLNALLKMHRDPSADGLLFNGENPRGWRALYGRLLAPIVDAVHANEGALTLDHFEFLDYIPVRRQQDGQPAWFAIDADEIGESTVYYDTEEQAWESRIPTDGTYLLERPSNEYASAEHFESLCDLHHESAESARYPEIHGDVTTYRANSNLTDQLSKEKVKHGILAAAPVRSGLAEAGRRYDRIVATFRMVDPTVTADSTGCRSWGVQRIADGDGIDLRGESVSDADGSFRPVVATRTDGRETTPTDLAELFQALFRGGQIDSYRLALTDGRVEGAEAVRRELIEESRQQLKVDLDIAGRLLDTESSIPDFELPDENDYTELREGIAEILRDETTLTADVEPPEAWNDVFYEYVLRLRSEGSVNARRWVGDWLQREEASQGYQELARDLSPDGFDSTVTVAEWKRQLLHRLITYTNEHPFLPDRSTDTVRRMASLVAGLQQSDTIDDVNLLTVSGDSAWDDPIGLTLPTADRESTADVFEAVVPEHATWFHLAWAQADREHPFVESVEFEALRDAFLDRLDGEPDGVKEEVAQQLEDRIAGNHREREYEPSTPDTDLLSSIEADLSTSDIGMLGDGAVPVGMRAASRNSTGTYTGSSGVSPRVAELLVLKEAYRGLLDSDTSREEAEDALDRLRDEDNYWHTNSGWREVEATGGSGLPDLDNLSSLADTFPIEAFDTTDEPRVGYDILDPTGAILPPDHRPSETAEGRPTSHLNPVPVEVKLVSSIEAPGFRFSVNQFRRALSFVSTDDGPHRPYVIALVALTEVDGRYRCEGYRTIVLDDVGAVYNLLSVDISPDSVEGSTVDQVIQDLVRSGHFIISG